MDDISAVRFCYNFAFGEAKLLCDVSKYWRYGVQQTLGHSLAHAVDLTFGW
jgi:hypothetical protein